MSELRHRHLRLINSIRKASGAGKHCCPAAGTAKNCTSTLVAGTVPLPCLAQSLAKSERAGKCRVTCPQETCSRKMIVRNVTQPTQVAFTCLRDAGFTCDAQGNYLKPIQRQSFPANTAYPSHLMPCQCPDAPSAAPTGLGHPSPSSPAAPGLHTQPEWAGGSPRGILKVQDLKAVLKK